MNSFGHSLRNHRLDRRHLLRGSGVAVSLPYLSAMTPAIASEQNAAAKQPKRFVGVTLGLGLLGDNLNPKDAGRDYTPSRYLEQMSDMRDDFTVISGASHPGVNGGHRAEACILTAAPGGGTGGSRNTISLDQLLAKHFGDVTRFPSLTLATDGSTSPCYTESGAMIPPISRAQDLFEMLFVTGSPKQRQAQAAQIAQGRSIMDLVSEDARSLERQLGGADRDRLDAYFTSVRDLEKRMRISERWAQRAKPEVDKPNLVVRDRSDFAAKLKVMTDIMKLAIKTDSTRFLTLHLGGSNQTLPLDGVRGGYHSLSHHGRDEDKLEQLALVETAIIGVWGEFVRELGRSEENGSRLLDNTSVLLTSNLGNASNHDNRNMPVLFAGGGFRHAGHLAFDKKENYPLPNLYLSVLQQSGLEVERFATSTGRVQELVA